MTFALGLMISGLCSASPAAVSSHSWAASSSAWCFGSFDPGGGRSQGRPSSWCRLAIALVCWFGYDQVATRLATLRDGVPLRERRPAFWARALPLVRDFPVWGTGCGTYEFVDMLYRSDAVDSDMVVDHAHNDYLEMLVEGGLAQLIPGVLAIVLVFRLGLRAVRDLEGESRPGGWRWGPWSASPRWRSTASPISGCISRRALCWWLSSARF